MRRRAHFLHLGKTGGTAIKAALEPHLHAGPYDIVLHDHATTLADVPGADDVFFCLRDPVARFVSGFNSRRRQGRPRYHYPWSPDEETAFARFDTPDALARALSGRRSHAHAQHAMEAIQHVRDPYSSVLGSIDDLTARQDTIVAVALTEHLDEDFERMTASLGVPDARLPRDAVAAHASPDPVDRRLSRRGRANLRRWYADDYSYLEWAVAFSRRSEDRATGS